MDEDLFFSIKTKDADTVEKILNREENIEFDGINVLEDLLTPGRIAFIVLGGDKPAWDTGLIGIGVITKPPYDKGYYKKNFKVQVSIKLLLHNPIKRADLVPYRDTYGTIGIAPITKWEPNQALSQVARDKAIALFRAMLEIDSSVEDDLKSLIGETVMGEVKATTTKMIEVPTKYGEDENEAIERFLQRGKKDENAFGETEITPEWFKEKATEFIGLDDEASDYLKQFNERFSCEKLQNLTGKNVLNEIFLNKDNKTNLCYTMEFDSDCRFIFGSIKSGTAYKYGLHYSQKNQKWATGSERKPQFLSEEEAIDLGTQIRDNLLAGIEVIKDYGDVRTISDYEKLQDELYDATDGYINRMWFMKYYAMMFPSVFPPIYSANAQKTVLNRLNLGDSDSAIVRMGMIRGYVEQCGISNVVFSRIFWKYCNVKELENDNDEEKMMLDENKLKNCLEIVREPRTNKVHPLNFIVYGAPGTGKTYSMVEYALSIIDGVSIDDFRKSNTDRKTNVSRYKELVKAGQIVFTTFHQNYGYEEFIQGLRPDKDSETMAFKTVDGVFKVIADTALNDTENKNYVIIIDEINRANISKVFGELITLIEEDKRWGELNETSATLQSGDQFAVPNNLYIVGTMNSADKSISLIDAALRRRFDFIEQKPDSALVPEGVLRKMFDNINENLVSELDSTDLLVGHSYFMKKTEKDLCNILNNNIIPLLYEYFYDNRKKVAKLLKDVIDKSGAQIEIVDEKVGRLRVKDKVE